MKQISITYPEFVEAATRLSSDELANQLRRKGALKMHELGQMAIDASAALAGISYVDFLDECARCGVSVFNYAPEDLADELTADLKTLSQDGAMSIVSSAGPLVGLARADALDLLKRLFREVHVSQGAHRQLLTLSGPELGRLNAALADFIRVDPSVEVPDEIAAACASLSEDERQGVALAHRYHVRLLADDRLERAAARAVPLAVASSVSVLVHGRKQGMLPRMTPKLAAMRQSGYWISDTLFETAANLAGERPGA